MIRIKSWASLIVPLIVVNLTVTGCWQYQLVAPPLPPQAPINHRVIVTLSRGATLAGRILHTTDSTFVLLTPDSPVEPTHQPASPLLVSDTWVRVHQKHGTPLAGQIVQVTAHEVVVRLAVVVKDPAPRLVQSVRSVAVPRTEIVAVSRLNSGAAETPLTLAWQDIRALQVVRLDGKKTAVVVTIPVVSVTTIGLFLYSIGVLDRSDYSFLGWTLLWPLRIWWKIFTSV
ncbi:MAG: hypothetical protein HY710_04000 [Candidatus Latescibacteria bacterium]|nr:hypothetical protein [Candidatus Latescibacterota bacterium]